VLAGSGPVSAAYSRLDPALSVTSYSSVSTSCAPARARTRSPATSISSPAHRTLVLTVGSSANQRCTSSTTGRGPWRVTGAPPVAHMRHSRVAGARWSGWACVTSTSWTPWRSTPSASACRAVSGPMSISTRASTRADVATRRLPAARCAWHDAHRQKGFGQPSAEPLPSSTTSTSAGAYVWEASARSGRGTPVAVRLSMVASSGSSAGTLLRCAGGRQPGIPDDDSRQCVVDRAHDLGGQRHARRP
jgi:hypothetical protein